MKPANDELFTLAESAKDWFFCMCVTVGAVSVFAIALAST